MSRLNLKVVGSFMGNCLIITDNESGQNIEIMALQLDSIVRSGNKEGSLPHASWQRDGELITICHDNDKDNHTVSFTLEELSQLA